MLGACPIIGRNKALKIEVREDNPKARYCGSCLHFFSLSLSLPHPTPLSVCVCMHTCEGQRESAGIVLQDAVNWFCVFVLFINAGFLPLT